MNLKDFTTETINRLLRVAAGDQIARDIEEIYAERSAAFAEIERATSAFQEQQSALNASVVAATERVKRLEDDLAEAKAEKCAAEHAQLCASIELGARRDRAESILLRTADPRIDEFIEQLNAVHARLREKISLVDASHFGHTGVWITAGSNNWRKIQNYAAALRDGIAAAQRLKVTAVDDIEQALQQIRDRLPSDDLSSEWFESYAVEAPRSMVRYG